MAMDSVNNLGTRDHLLDHIAYWLHKKDFARIDPTDQRFILDVFEFALDRVAGDAEWMNMRKEAGIATGFTGIAKFDGTTGSVTQGTPTFIDAAATFQTWGVRAGDFILPSTTEIAYRISSVDSETQVTFDQPYAQATAVGTLAYELGRDTFPLADDCWWFRSIQDMDNGNQIIIMSQQDFIERTDNREIFGRPDVVVMHDSPATGGTVGDTNVGQRVKFWRTPDAIQSLRYQYLALPTAIAQNSEFQPHMVQLLVHATLVDVWQQRDEGQKSQFHEGKYRQLLDMFRDRDQNRSQTPLGEMRRQFIPGVRTQKLFIARGPEIVRE